MSAKSTHCKRCGSDENNRFTAEVAIHFTGLQGLSKPIVWVFPDMNVCFRCGLAEFIVPDRELRVLRDGLPVEGALITTHTTG